MVDKTILVYDHLWLGHIPTYHIEICKCLIENGFNVISASPKPFDVKASFQNNQNIDLLEFRDTNLDCISEQNACNNENPSAKLTSANSTQSNNVSLFSIAFRILSKIPFFQRFFEILENWKTLNQNINKKINASNIIVFIPYLDSGWLHPLLSNRLISKKIDFKWVGILIHPKAGDRKRVELFSPFKSKTCQAIFMLDEMVINTITNKTIKAKLHTFPDITNVEFDTSFSSPLIKAIHEKKHGKKVVTLIGALDPRKNLKLFLLSAKLADEKKLPYIFVLAGPTLFYLWENKEEAAFVENILKSPPKNLIVQLERIPDGIQYNAIILNSDYIFAIFKNFNGSSNSLTKSTYFKKPILVDKSFLMGQMVEKYCIGKTVSKKTSHGVISALQQIDTSAFGEENFEKYYDNHSLSRLNEIMLRIFAL